MRRLLAALALAVAVSGCASSTSNTTVGPTLSVYSILPLHGPRAADAEDIVDGEKLALRDAGGKVGQRIVNFRSVDSGAGAQVTAGSAAAAARLAAQDASAIAVIGTLRAGEARAVVPLVDEARLPLVSPAVTYPGLTRAVPGVTATGEPDRLFPSGRRTFSRVIGSDVTQAPAIAAVARRAGCRRLDVLAGPEADDAALAALVAEAIPGRTTFGLGEAASVSGGCVLIASGDPVAAARATRAVRARTIIAPSALVDAAFARAARPGTRLVSPVPALRHLPAEAARTSAAFRRAFGRPATAWSLLGYDAMRSVLEAIRRAGPKGDDRVAVAKALTDGIPRPSVLGTAALGPDGDPNPAHWSEGFVRAGAPALGRPLR
jgi:branched-chain amino acid transport system substrate-binding protein